MQIANTFIVAVGDFDPDELKAQLEEKLPLLAPSAVMAMKQVGFEPHAGELVTQVRMQPAKYVLFKFPGPEMGDPAYPALAIGLRYLSRSLWEEVRTRHALSYAVYCSLSGTLTPYGYFYISTTNESAALPLILAEIEKLKREPMAQKELDDTRAVYTTQYYQSQESTAALAGQLASGEIYYNDYRKRDRLMRDIADVTPEDIQKAAQTYLNGFTFAVVGDVENLDRAAFGLE